MKRQTIILLLLIGLVIICGASVESADTTASANQCIKFDAASLNKFFSDISKDFIPANVNDLNTVLNQANKTAINKDTFLSAVKSKLYTVSDDCCKSYQDYIDNSSFLNKLNICDSLIQIPIPIRGRAEPVVIGKETLAHLKPYADNETRKYLDISDTIEYKMLADNTTSEYCKSVISKVIVPAIDKARGQIKLEMAKTPPTSIEGVLADVIKYHGACTLDSGISLVMKRITGNSSDSVTKILRDSNIPTK